ncbi:hypothetical protein EV356DRAFT_578003 [Viridothelium virens]|uniref:Uncharacterized protein n=1 Tax=Viridothelium virens TaxID=1048519 RepID=A0A6A6H4A7_VIRVR|nr:hypothetical protein EV356DRAFT_578003 [Viridothelium virens]
MSASRQEIPLPSEQPLEVDYLQNRQYHYKNTNVTFDVERQHFVPNPLEPDQHRLPFDSLVLSRENELQLARTTSSFTKAVKELQKRKGSEVEIGKFSFEGAHNWNEVDEIVKSAEGKYLKKDSVSGKIRAMFRKIGSNGKSLQSFVGLLPDGNYKTLCGGLTLILSAMMRHSDIREKIAEVMEELPEDIGNCEEYSSIYPGQNELRFRVEELYIDLLSTFEEFVKWYMQGTARHVRESLLKNENYGQAIDRYILNIRKSRTLFQAAVAKFLHWRLEMVHGTVLETKEIVRDSRSGIEKLSVQVEDAKKGAQEIGQGMIRRVSTLEARIMNKLQEILGDQTKNAKWQSEVERLKEALLQTTKEKDREIDALKKQIGEISWTPESLADTLDLVLDCNDHISDGGDVRNFGLNEEPQFQTRSKWIAETSGFRNWVSSSDSGMIYIQGNGELEPITPASFLSVLLEAKLLESDEVLVLQFFCGLHGGGQLQDSDDSSGPLTMVRALLAQILSLDGVDWTQDASGYPYLSLNPADVSGLRKLSFSTHLKVIGNILNQLQLCHKAIFIILDGLDWYDMTWGAEIKHLTKSLLRMVSSEQATGVLKVFLSAATHLNYVPRADENFVSVEIPEEIFDEDDSFEEID